MYVSQSSAGVFWCCFVLVAIDRHWGRQSNTPYMTTIASVIFCINVADLLLLLIHIFRLSASAPPDLINAELCKRYLTLTAYGIYTGNRLALARVVLNFAMIAILDGVVVRLLPVFFIFPSL
jgi:hypothetical protein